MSVIFKGPFHALETLEDYRRSLVESMAFQMINGRFAEIVPPARRAVPGGLGRHRHASVGTVSGARASAPASRTARPSAASRRSPRKSPASASSGSERPSSIARAAATLAQYERLYNERNNTTSDPLASELLRHYLSREAVPGIERELEYARRFLTTITIAEVSAFAREIIHDDNRVVLSSAPERQGLAPVTQAQLRSALTAGLAASVTPWSDQIEGKALMAKAPVPGTVKRAPRGARDWRHRADALERRRGVAEADRLPRRPGGLQLLRPRRHLVVAGRAVLQRVAQFVARRHRRRRRAVAGRPREAAGREDRRRVGLHLAPTRTA